MESLITLYNSVDEELLHNVFVCVLLEAKSHHLWCNDESSVLHLFFGCFIQLCMITKNLLAEEMQIVAEMTNEQEMKNFCTSVLLSGVVITGAHNLLPSLTQCCAGC